MGNGNFVPMGGYIRTETGRVNGRALRNDTDFFALNGGDETMLGFTQLPSTTYAGLPAIRLNQDMLDMLRANVKRVLSDSCQAFIERLIGIASQRYGSKIVSTNVLELFDLVGSNQRGPDMHGNYGGIWGYLVPTGSATAGGDWINGAANIGLPMSNYMHYRRSSSQFNDLSDGMKAFLQVNSFYKFMTSDQGALLTIHELIHLSLQGLGDSDLDLARAALELTGETLDMGGLSDSASHITASGIWTTRLGEACGIQTNYRKGAFNKYIIPK